MRQRQACFLGGRQRDALYTPMPGEEREPAGGEVGAGAQNAVVVIMMMTAWAQTPTAKIDPR
jgi:hypothetical protein